MSEINTKQISFSIDSGLIDRLGRELVGKAETAVSELIKNSYDADATQVEVNFINTELSGGTLIIEDNGVGMTYEQLINGFMVISSSDKIHNPISKRYQRSKAGKKGIGRFATQRLGTLLTIITQTIQSTTAYKITIDWNKYLIDTDITRVTHTIEEVEKDRDEGTTLYITNLRESWNEKAVERVYRYVSELLQPDYLSENSRTLGLAKKDVTLFHVIFYTTNNDVKKAVASQVDMLFDKAIATIEGYIDQSGDGYYALNSKSLEIDDYAIPIENEGISRRFSRIRNIYFKCYYFIYNRTEYYTNISKLELKNIQNISKDFGGVRVYRNGFRVLPYGEPTDDWIGLDIRYSGEVGLTNIPYSNKNIFGFVEIVDQEGTDFEETASREGLIDGPALEDLRNFMHKALISARGRISEGITIIRNKKRGNTTNKEEQKRVDDRFDTLRKLINEEAGTENSQFKQEATKAIEELQDDYINSLEEIGMLRVLAGLGLTIAEFTHEIIQFTPSINGYLYSLSERLKGQETELIENMRRTINNVTSYTSYFNTTVSQNVSRELRPILLIDVINTFTDTIFADLNKQIISKEVDFYGFDLYTIPMHHSEWSSIFFNLYTNSKKAIKRAEVEGKIKFIAGKEKEYIYIEFLDNGDGIPKENENRIFNPFFTTSTPANFDSSNEDKLTGTGLGLKIVKDTIETYGGRIFLVTPEASYSTAFRIEIPAATKKQLNDYGL
ncbi:ATP-binding protein [Ferruginibacter yonginensis]|uniref:histidine kinase n=1 Tax=Ferruginibacter yonginensis TaxID=1310416 RepID=A0ABV8QVR0_9BACT